MSDFEDKISSILSNPAEMEKITRLASQLMGAPSPAQAGAPRSGQSAAAARDGSADSDSTGISDGAGASGLGALFGPGGPLSGLAGPGSTSGQSSASGHDGASGHDSALDSFPDAGMLRRLGAMLASGAQDDKTALLRAMGPYMSPERRAKLEKAIKFARLARVAKAVFGESGQNTEGPQDV